MDDTTDRLLAELRELARDVTGDPALRARRLALLRRVERRERGPGSPGSHRSALAAGTNPSVV